MKRGSGTRSPGSMKRLASTPSGETAFTAARSMSHVEMCGMPNFSLMKVAWVPLPAPGAPNRIKRMVISPNRIETAALRGLFLHPVAMAHRPVEAANEARRAEFGRRRGTSRHGRSGALALTGRLALPIDYAMHRHNRGPNPRLESPASGAQRGLTRVDRKGAAALGGVENEPISRGGRFGAQRKCRRSPRVRRDATPTPATPLPQPTRPSSPPHPCLI